MTAATIAMGRATRVAVIAESAFGTTPSTPAFKTLRPTTSSLRPKLNKGQSQEFSTSRHVYGDFVTGIEAEGRIEAEFTHTNWDTLLEGAFCGSWSTDVLKAGSTRKYFTIEETYTNASQYNRYLGSAIETFELTADPNDTIRLSFDIMSREMTRTGTAISGATYTAPNYSNMPGTTGGISGVTWSGISATPIVRSFRLQIKNNWVKIPVFDDNRSVQFGIGMQDVTGEVTVYFDDYGIYSEIATQSFAGFSMLIGDVADSRYLLELHDMRWGDGALEPRRREGPVTLTMPFRCVYKDSESTTVTLTRAHA